MYHFLRKKNMTGVLFVWYCFESSCRQSSDILNFGSKLESVCVEILDLYVINEHGGMLCSKGFWLVPIVNQSEQLQNLDSLY